MSETNENFNQDEFINNAIKNESYVSIYLLNGIKLNGNIKSIDKHSITLVRDGHSILIYKRAVGTISPQ